jgi:hypothetical protein
VKRWQSLRRQRRRRAEEEARKAHQEAEKERRKRRKEALQNDRNPSENTELREERGHAHEAIPKKSICARPGCYNHPKQSLRTPAIYCCDECRDAVRRVRDRERKWLARASFAGRLKRGIEYESARQKRRSGAVKRQ